MSLTKQESAFDQELTKIRRAVSMLAQKRPVARVRELRTEAALLVSEIDRFREWCHEHLEEKPTAPVLIWSEEHQAWWLTPNKGYTRSIVEAARYPMERALKIEADANRHLDIEKGEFHEVIVRDPLPL